MMSCSSQKSSFFKCIVIGLLKKKGRVEKPVNHNTIELYGQIIKKYL